MLNKFPALHGRLTVALALVLGGCALVQQSTDTALNSDFPTHCAHAVSSERIECVVQYHKHATTPVYQRYRSLQSNFAGKLVFVLTISVDGVVNYISTEQNTTGSKDFEREISAILKALNYGSFEAAGVHRYTMSFLPE
ncbi:MAG: hypothetical protein OEZ39_17965 [Gammaproteobacteria bacterium]|nr:hypothetical protein [Gammaproteobacteria bacterium]MDH5653753.1 hypothetical protein [Gammaproteobacteria bacterium]